MAAVTPATEVHYPDSDGKPMAESDYHYRLLVDTRERLAARYAARSDVYVSGNLLVYYLQGNPRASLAPDVFVVFGVSNRRRRSYRTWVEGVFPQVVFEFTSESTAGVDLNDKFDIYQDVWKVSEYFLFDPQQEFLDTPLIGYRRVGGELRPMRATAGVLTSKVLAVAVSADGPRLVLRDLATGGELLTEAEQRAEQEARRATAAEAEVARLKAELAALRKKAGN